MSVKPEDFNVSDEFCDKIDSLQDAIEEICAEEDHAGATVCALVNALATNLHDMCESNGIDRDEATKTACNDLMEYMQKLKDGTYWENTVN